MMQHTQTPRCPPAPKTPPPWPTVTYNVGLKEELPSQWHMIYNGQDYGPTQYPQLNVPCNTTGVFNFSITEGANFATQAIGIVGGSAKPPHAGVANGQISVTSQTTTALSFTDSNNNPSHNTLNYILYFNDNSQLDPIIDNGGCCGRSNFFSSPVEITGGELALYLLIAFVAGMVALMGVRAMRRGG
jgi:hypothetical protein